MEIGLVYSLLLLCSTGYALILQKTKQGQWLAGRRTWLSVVLGVGLVLLASLILIPREHWFIIVGAFGIAGAPICIRSFLNEYHDEKASLNLARKGQRAKHDD